jgi:hypothetical protein
MAAGALVAAMLGCGSPPPPTPRPAPPPPSTVTAQPPPQPGASETPPPIAIDQELGPILQALVDAPPLEMYFHVDELPERAPLRIARTDAVQAEPPLEKFGAPVLYQDPAELANLPYLEIVSIERVTSPTQGEGARIRFRYPVEGIVGEAIIGPIPEGGWRLLRAEISER